MFLLVPAHPGFPGQIPQSRKTVVCFTPFSKQTAYLQQLQCAGCIHRAVQIRSYPMHAGGSLATK